MKRVLFSILVCLFAVVSLCAQNEISYRIEKSFDRMFYNSNNPVIDVTVYNKDNYEKHADTILCKVLSDDGKHIYSFRQRYSVSPSDSAQLSFSFPLKSGFYKVCIEREDTVMMSANIGYEPEKLHSFADSTFSFDDTWSGILSELRATPVGAEVIKVKKLKTKFRNIYSLKLKSIGGGVVEGFIAVPKKKGTYKTVITCIDKDENLVYPSGDIRPEIIDVVVSPRKGWLHKEYYYRTLCLDVVRAVDYVCEREDVDLKNIFLQGKGRGGAFVVAACALDNRVAAAAVYAPGLSNESATNELKPYDIKNLSGRVECPVVMGVGLEDDICLPRQNFEIYNLINSPKQYYIFVEGHTPPDIWGDIALNFFSKYER